MSSDLSLYDIADEFEKNGGKLLLIDEIHKRKSFDSELKMIYDVLKIKVVFSGSSALQILNADISRRAIIYRLPTLSFREFLSLELKKPFKSYSIEEILSHHVDIASEIASDAPIIKYFKEYLRDGLYPFFTEGKGDFLIKLEEILVKIVDEDIPTIYGTNYEMQVKIKMLLKMICKGSPKEINISKLSKDSGIYREKMYEILFQIREASLIRTVGSDASGGKLLNKPHKLYLDNTSLFWALCSDHDIGNIRETFLASMLEGAKKSIEYPKRGDFLVDGKYLFEVGGQGKEFGQIGKDEGCIVQDDIDMGVGRKIPLWLFGFLY